MRMNRLFAACFLAGTVMAFPLVAAAEEAPRPEEVIQAAEAAEAEPGSGTAPEGIVCAEPGEPVLTADPILTAEAEIPAAAETEIPAASEVPAETETPAETEIPAAPEVPAETEMPAEPEAKALPAENAVMVEETAAPEETVTAAASTGAVTAGSLADGIYYLSFGKARTKVLDVAGGGTANGSNVQIYEKNQSAAQQFRLEYLEEKQAYRLSNVKSGKVLDVAGASKAAGANVQIYEWNGSAAQLWQIIRDTDGDGVQLQSVLNQFCLDVTDGGTDNRTNVRMMPAEGSAESRRFFLEWISSLPEDPQGTGGETPSAGNKQAVADGMYYVFLGLEGQAAMDVSGGSTQNGANVQLYAWNKSDAQKFILKYDPTDGRYTITNVKSGKALDVAGGSKADGANVQIYEANGSEAQKWTLRKTGSRNTFQLLSALNEKALSANLPLNASNAANLRIMTEDGGEGQSFRLMTVSGEKPVTYTDTAGGTGEGTSQGGGTQPAQEPETPARPADAADLPDLKTPLADGLYRIASALNQYMNLDVAGGKKSNSANIRLYEVNNSSAQKFRLMYDKGSGTYRFRNLNSGLSVHVQDGKTGNGANVCQYEEKNEDGQKWILKDAGNGLYSIVSALSGKVMDAAGGGTANGTNIQLYTYNGSEAQKFAILPVSESAVPENGIYTLVSAADGKAAIDVNKASMHDAAQVTLFQPTGGDNQKFILYRENQGGYRIINYNSGKYLSIEGQSNAANANIYQLSGNGTDAQRWYLREAQKGEYFLVSALSGKLLESAGGSAANGANIQTGNAAGTAGQRFRLVRQNVTPAVQEGTYTIALKADNTKVIDIAGGDRRMGANAQVYTGNNSNAQKYRISKVCDGLLLLTNVKSKHVLEAEGASRSDRGNIDQYRPHGSLAQMWIPHKNSNGSISFINAASSKALDVDGGSTRNGANIQQYTWSGNLSQQFVLKAASGTDNTAIDYSVVPKDLYPQANKVLNQVGRNLQAALNWSAGLRYVDSGKNISVGTRALANIGFTTGTGDCYVMAATFYEMAKALGYTAHQMFGYVPLARGGMGEHSWVEIVTNGTTYVCDPDFQNETGNNGYMIHYGMSGTWRYSDYRRIN